MDRTIKVWNLSNIFEDVHHIDRLETKIDSISVSVQAGIAVTATRGCIGIWELLTGKLQARLANSSYGAIVSDAIVTTPGNFIIAAESGLVLYWKVEDRSVIFQQKQTAILQVMLFNREQKSMVVSRMLPDLNVLCIARSIPEGEQIYEFKYPIKQYKNIVLTSDGKYFACYGYEKTKDTLFLFGAETGDLYQKFQLKYPNFKEASMIVAMPDRSGEIALIDGEKGTIISTSTKKVSRCIPTWGGKFASNNCGIKMVL